jgi:DNA-binding XRE family transcriptional regulator
MPKTPKPIDFTKVESLRRHMLLRTKDMAGLVGVTRMTYYGWQKGKPIRKKNDAKIRKTLQLLLVVLTEHAWPQPQVIAMEPNERLETLNELVTSLSNPTPEQL